MHVSGGKLHVSVNTMMPARYLTHQGGEIILSELVWPIPSSNGTRGPAPPSTDYDPPNRDSHAVALDADSNRRRLRFGVTPPRRRATRTFVTGFLLSRAFAPEVTPPSARPCCCVLAVRSDENEVPSKMATAMHLTCIALPAHAPIMEDVMCLGNRMLCTGKP